MAAIASAGKKEISHLHRIHDEETPVCGYVDVVQLATVHADKLFFSASVRNWALAMWSLSIATQVSATSLIAWKIWSAHHRAIGAHGNPRITSVLWIVIESGAILSVAHVLVLAFYLDRVAVNGILNNMMGQLCVSLPSITR